MTTGSVPSPDFSELAAFDVPHPRPCIMDFVVEPDATSSVVDHVSNIEYVRWLDRAAEHHADTLGFTRRSMLDAGRMWFVARHEIDYRREAKAGERLLMVTWVRDMRRAKSWRDFLLVRPADDAVIVQAATLWVYVNLATRRPCRVPADMVSRFDPLLPTPCRRDDERCASP